MSKCENCIHNEACQLWCKGYAESCDTYKDKSLFVELPCRQGKTAISKLEAFDDLLKAYEELVAKMQEINKDYKPKFVYVRRRK